MGILEQLATLILDDRPLLARSVTQDWVRSNPVIELEPPPISADARISSLVAGLAEMFAERLHQHPPIWTSGIGPAPEPIYLVRSSRTMRRLRELCRRESPMPLRRRRIFAPPDYLMFV